MNTETLVGDLSCLCKITPLMNTSGFFMTMWWNQIFTTRS